MNEAEEHIETIDARLSRLAAQAERWRWIPFARRTFEERIQRLIEDEYEEETGKPCWRGGFRV